eukprot:gnl/Dysnectes_brevis/8250_a14529_242.p1 GENE.gnl/Dysnectes_brevis/8250_a14529_242~~gnl/Dysnectes_brevis/8250_a14529_242.p1  ORF type:complete len:213 (+),score=17.14 gnl/Dysnectes_brevis/8250_a14529_242:65-703(+)
MDRRIIIDILELKKKYPVDPTDSTSELFTYILGPLDTAYQNGIFKLRISLPEAYPLKSPSVAFVTRIIHPNVDLGSGSICLDVLNQTWLPMFSLLNVFDSFLPQLLTYPNDSDPLNADAARQFRSDKMKYDRQVRAAVEEFGLHPEDLPPHVPLSFCTQLAERGHITMSGEGAGVGGADLGDYPGDEDESTTISLFDFDEGGTGTGADGRIQ